MKGSIFPILSKVYERLIYNGMYPYWDKYFSKSKCCFRKGFNAQHCLITVIEKGRRAVDECGQAGTLNSKALCVLVWSKFLALW